MNTEMFKGMTKAEILTQYCENTRKFSEDEMSFVDWMEYVVAFTEAMSAI